VEIRPSIIVVYSSVEIVNAYEQGEGTFTVLGDYRKLLELGINFVPRFVSNTYLFDIRTKHSISSAKKPSRATTCP
jgi:hypothetical protein